MTRRALMSAASLLLTAALLIPSLSSADYREFSGRIDMVKKKKFVVESRQGDKVSFVFIAETQVTGQRKSAKKIKKGDWVTVSWKLADKPRKAYKIVVSRAREKND